MRAHTCVLYIYIYHELLKKTNHTTIIVNHDTDDGDGDDCQQRRQSHSREHVSLTALGLHSFGLGMILSRRGTPWPMHELPTRTGPTRKIWSRLEGTRFNLLETLSREKLYKCRRSLFHIGISAPGAPSHVTVEAAPRPSKDSQLKTEDRRRRVISCSGVLVCPCDCGGTCPHVRLAV